MLKKTPAVASVADDLFLITLVPPLKGFDAFITAWLHTGTPAFLVDVGPAVTAPALLRALSTLSIKELDYILLTHIHLDHAGAIGQIAPHFPATPIVCHPQAIPHLCDPERLWHGTVKTLGATGQAYGAPIGVPESRLKTPEQMASPQLAAALTPGHAAHHVAFWTDRYLFAGEAAGVVFDVPAKQFYMRPATPPKFYDRIYLDSLDTLMKVAAPQICYSHYGIRSRTRERLLDHRQQIELWLNLAIEVSRQYEHAEERMNRGIERLLAEDARLQAYHIMDNVSREREDVFLRNSWKGVLGAVNRAERERSAKG
jgi:glyoxylase-like metal-dependent hydrolase (beta-lactamase superfamily II)